MALQRINQELEDKLYRMVRAATRCPVAPPGTPTPGSSALDPRWDCRPSCHLLARARAESQALFPDPWD